MPDNVFFKKLRSHETTKPAWRPAFLGIVIVATALAFVAARSAAEQEQTAASRFALALVNDVRGKAVVDIGADDFVVQEAGVNRDVLDVRVADYPIAVILDNGSAAKSDFASIKSAVVRFVERLGPRPLAVVTMAGMPKMVASLEDERETVLERLNGIEEPGGEPAQPLQAAATATRAIQATGTLFSAVVVATASPIELSGTAADEFLAPIVDSRAVVHVVANEGNRAPSGSLFRGLAKQTRGDFTPIYAAPSFVPAFERLAARLTTELMIEYLVPVGSKAVDPKIGVRIPGARVLGLGVAPR